MNIDANFVALTAILAGGAELRWSVASLRRDVRALDREKASKTDLFALRARRAGKALAGALVAVAALLLLSGCSLGLRSPPIAGPATGLHGGSVLASVATWGAWVGAVGVIICAALAVAGPRRLWALKWGAASLAVIVASRGLAWYAAHEALLAVLAVVGAGLCAGVWVWLHRQALEKPLGIDLNHDGRLGPSLSLVTP